MFRRRGDTYLSRGDSSAGKQRRCGEASYTLHCIHGQSSMTAALCAVMKKILILFILLV